MTINNQCIFFITDNSPVTSESGSLNLIPVIFAKNIEIDFQERVFLGEQLSFSNVYKKYKYLSLNDLTVDTQDKIKCTKRSLSAPSAYEILDIYEPVSLLFPEAYNSNVSGGYDYSEAQTIDESRTDCETSGDEYGNMSEGRKRCHVSRKEKWKKMKLKIKECVGRNI